MEKFIQKKVTSTQTYQNKNAPATDVPKDICQLKLDYLGIKAADFGYWKTYSFLFLTRVNSE